VKYSFHASNNNACPPVPLVHQFLKSQQLGCPEAATSRQAHRRQPERRTIGVTLDVDVRWLDAVRRVEEDTIGSLVMDRRHPSSVPRSVSVAIPAANSPSP